MIGKQQIVFGTDDLIKGISTSQHIKDAGFSNAEGAVNLAVTPGLAYSPADTVDSDTDVVLTDEIIASCEDHQTSGINEKEVVTEDGKYYRYNGTKLGSALATDSTNTFAKGFTDMIRYKGETYITTQQRIIRWTGASTFDTSTSGLAFTNTSSPHPALVFEDNAYFGDGNLLVRKTAAGTAHTTVLTLPSGEQIYALGIDRGTGKILISSTSHINMANTLPSIYKLYWYDGFSNKTAKAVYVDDMICSFYSIGNTTLIGYGQNLGYLSGSGINFLYRFRNVTLAQQALPYKHNFTNIGQTVYIVDGDQILAYGPVQKGGASVLYYLYLNDITVDQTFKCIFNAGNNKLGISSSTSKFHTLDVTSTGSVSNGLDITTNTYQFPRPVYIRGAWLNFADSTNSANLTLQYRFDDGSTRALAIEGGNYSDREFHNLVGFLPTKTTSIFFRVALASQNSGFRKLIVHYDYAE